MIGNAVPVNLAKILAQKIHVDIREYLQTGSCQKIKTISTPKQMSLIFP
jgi:DNA (cytosine-5)-methyltransferase 1